MKKITYSEAHDLSGGLIIAPWLYVIKKASELFSTEDDYCNTCEGGNLDACSGGAGGW